MESTSTEKTIKKFALIGKNLSHSYSKKIFDKIFREKVTNGEYEYELIELSDINEIDDYIKKNSNLYGFNVTYPYKGQIKNYIHRQYMDNGMSCNCVRIIRTPKYIIRDGFNTDWDGFIKSILRHDFPLVNNILILGNGSVSKTIQTGIKNTLYLPSSKIDVVSRWVGADFIYGELTPEEFQKYKLIINCTSLGTSPNIDEAPDIPYDAILPDQHFFDVVYNPEQSRFLREAALRGAKTLNGKEMLIYQAILSYHVWGLEIPEQYDLNNNNFKNINLDELIR